MVDYLLKRYRIEPLKKLHTIRLNNEIKLEFPKYTCEIATAICGDVFEVYLHTNEPNVGGKGDKGLGSRDFKLKYKTELEEKIDKFVELIAKKK